MYNNLPKTLFLGKTIFYLPTCHSTNDIATTLLGKPEIFEGTVIISSNQTAGKGQRGNTWEAEPYKNLTFSIIFKPAFLKVNQQFHLNIAISLAVYDLLTIYLGEKVKIKWPNDIYFQEGNTSQKICGMLIQNTIKKDSLENSVVGIGLNINQETFTYPIATSLKLLTGREHDLESVFNLLMEKIEARYLQLKEGKSQVQEYLSGLFWYRQPRMFKAAERFKGTIVGIDEIGRLMVEKEGKIQLFNFKEVEFVE